MVPRRLPSPASSSAGTKAGPGAAASEGKVLVNKFNRRDAMVDAAKLQLDVALYIEALSADLRAMAKTADLRTLAYFLEMVRMEASIQVENHAHARGVPR
jgi:hypothetical protein